MNEHQQRWENLWAEFRETLRRAKPGNIVRQYYDLNRTYWREIRVDEVVEGVAVFGAELAFVQPEYRSESLYEKRWHAPLVDDRDPVYLRLLWDRLTEHERCHLEMQHPTMDGYYTDPVECCPLVWLELIEYDGADDGCGWYRTELGDAVFDVGLALEGAA